MASCGRVSEDEAALGLEVEYLDRSYIPPQLRQRRLDFFEPSSVRFASLGPTTPRRLPLSSVLLSVCLSSCTSSLPFPQITLQIHPDCTLLLLLFRGLRDSILCSCESCTNLMNDDSFTSGGQGQPETGIRGRRYK